eukprot:8275635-Pyramimonas_sp.AAC.1
MSFALVLLLPRLMVLRFWDSLMLSSTLREATFPRGELARRQSLRCTESGARDLPSVQLSSGVECFGMLKSAPVVL